jgi:aldehyde dehydrogenase (NAD+)
MKTPISQLFAAQKANQSTLKTSSVAQRKQTLKKLKVLVQQNESAIFEALKKDLGKPLFEAAVTEVYFVYAEIDFALKNLSSWMKPQRVAPTLTSLFTKNRILYEPKGLSLIISPWNYPFQLAISPLVSAIAAGNAVIIKPSELSPATSALLYSLISANFATEDIACVEGDAEVAKELLSLPFDHIFFTGSTAIGKVVMRAAADHLASVTLELGGKIVWGKYLNVGQTCIAPDYVMLPEHLLEKFVDLAAENINKLFTLNGQLNTEAYGSIINNRHFDRQKKLFDDAIAKGAKLRIGGQFDADALRISPTVLSNVSPDSGLMQEEIFGPLLPLITYKSLDEAIARINAQGKPLALYVFGNSAIAKQVISQTSAGGTLVNDVLVHISNPNLPFGGVQSSGTGSCHGFYGFKAFSHERSVMYQSAVDFNWMVYPPYNMSLLKLLKRIF